MRNLIRKILTFIPDRLFIQYHYFRFFGEWLSFNKIRKFSQALNYYKYNHVNESYGIYVDKYKVRQYVSSMIGDNVLPKLYGVYFSSDKFSLKELPNSFALKLNNGSGCNLIIKDKCVLDEAELKEKLNDWLKEKYYIKGRENQYKDVTNCIICEELLNGIDGDLPDYKLYCFNGKVEFIQVITNHEEHNYYDVNWNSYGIRRKEYIVGVEREKPYDLDRMISYAETLSSKFVFCRVDFYITTRGIIFGEITFTPGGGMIRFYPESKDNYLAGLMHGK